jgi:F-type H+-transporting ATPase subunit b
MRRAFRDAIFPGWKRIMAQGAPLNTSQEIAHVEHDFPPFDAHNFAPQIIWLVLTFGALYLLMSRIALPRVEGILQTREAKISGDLDAATTMRGQADDAAAAYEKTLAEAKARAQATAQDMRDKINAESETRRKSLEAELNAKLDAAEKQIAATRAQAMTSVTAIATEAAEAIVKQITGRAADPADVAAAVARNG